jgi:outer membrane biosynthesis protein TonB
MDIDDDEEKRGFLQKYGFVLGITTVILVIGGMVVGQISKGEQAPVRKMPEVFMVRPLPPPPPPPPPPKVEPPKEVEKMMEQTPVDDPEPKPDNSPKEAAPALTTNVTGSGNDGFGLGAGGSGGEFGGGGGRPRSRFGWYAGEVQRAIQEALSRNHITSEAQFENKARIWADASGRVTRVKLDGSTGDQAVDQAIADSLTGLQLQDAPPGDMPMPIVMRIQARRPN